MNTSFAARTACTVALLAGLCWVSLPVSAAAYSKVYAFGDSLSDTGNFLSATGGALPQSNDYFEGRFSNGRAAVEYLAQGLGVSLVNFAYGGAETTALNGAAVAAGAPLPLQNTGLQSQLGFFQAALTGNADANGLYFIWAGANDFQYRGVSASVAQTAIANLALSVQLLYRLGARSFLLPGMPDLGLTPQGLAAGDATSAALQNVSRSFNAGLTNPLGTGAYDQLKGLSGISITFFDVYAAQHELIENPGAHNLSNVTQGCFTGYVGLAGTQCSDPSGYLYWDRVHPSAVAHQYFGQQMLAAVPEPQTLLMMSAGLLALLGLARRRH